MRAANRRRNGPLVQARRTPLAIPRAVATMPIQIMGLPVLMPNPALNHIATLNSFVVVQAMEPLEMFAGIETPNQYVVHDALMRPILFAHERSNAMVSQFAPTTHDFRMDVMDAYGRPLMFTHRSNTFGDDRVFTEYPPGNIIGFTHKAAYQTSFTIGINGVQDTLMVQTPVNAAVRNMGGFGGGGFGGGAMVVGGGYGGGAMVVGGGGYGGGRGVHSIHTMQDSVFPIFTMTGAFIGEITRLYPGYLKESISDADTFLVHFPPNLPVHMKLVLLSTVFLIDFTYFEH